MNKVTGIMAPFTFKTRPAADVCAGPNIKGPYHSGQL